MRGIQPGGCEASFIRSTIGAESFARLHERAGYPGTSSRSWARSPRSASRCRGRSRCAPRSSEALLQLIEYVGYARAAGLLGPTGEAIRDAPEERGESEPHECGASG